MAEKLRLSTMIGRALRRRCPRCSHGPIHRGWFRLHDHCPGCGHRFEREPGFWVGAVTFNTALGIGVFLVSFGFLLVITWPSVPWPLVAPLTGGLGVLAVIFGYPYVKLLWVAYDLALHPLEPHEVEGAKDRRPT